MKFRRLRQAQWDKRHLVTVSTHLTEQQYQTLRALCTLDNDRPYNICRRALLEYINREGVKTGNPDLDLFASGILEDEPEKVLVNTPIFPAEKRTSRRERLTAWRRGEE